METRKASPHFGDLASTWPIPSGLSDFEAYGLWNSLSVYDRTGELLAVIPAHDGDFFPESPLDHVEVLREAVLSHGETPRVFWPVRVDVDVTQNCTNNCYFCYSREYAFEPRYRGAEMSPIILERLVEELARGGTRTIRFTGGGEPLLHPEIERMLSVPRRYGLRSCVITNGDLLNEKLIELLVSDIDHIRLSLNAARDDTRRAVHRPITEVNDLSSIFRHLRQISELRNIIWPSERRPSIWTTFLLLPENVGEVYLAAQMARDCGADSISFRPIYHDLSSPLSKDGEQRLQVQLERALTLHSPPAFCVFTPKRDLSIAAHLSPEAHFARCISCRVRTVIEATGQGPMIKVCGLHRGVNGNSLGLVREDLGFGAIWNSAGTSRLLSERPRVCGNCIDVSMNVTLNRLWAVLVEHPDAIVRKSWHRMPAANRGAL
jgi:MoaA/NifB/PqqE/SkfB family radical SAM enzyme